MKKLSVLVAGAALSAIAVGAATPVTTAASASPVAAASHEKATDRGGATSEAEIAALFDRWNAALGSGDPEKVAALYAPHAVLLPTASPQIRTTHAGIVDYSSTSCSATRSAPSCAPSWRCWTTTPRSTPACTASP